ncbi:(Na+)-NQR maturation NqrM [Serratia microhaemolytica]|uniref:(Na+)-NQR maturation NqrM n=1 Tax=Serratia microhaemolytica TaxID=2675110 RepID=UPI000FDE6964|nr:(Na+)-NQR maturation NqrM [Serratia microhaemolytica]
MLKIFVISFVLFLLVMLAMSLGYIFRRKMLQGSCGGITALGIEKVCNCPEPCDAKKKRMAKEAERREQLEKRRIL